LEFYNPTIRAKSSSPLGGFPQSPKSPWIFPSSGMMAVPPPHPTGSPPPIYPRRLSSLPDRISPNRFRFPRKQTPLPPSQASPGTLPPAVKGVRDQPSLPNTLRAPSPPLFCLAEPSFLCRGSRGQTSPSPRSSFPSPVVPPFFSTCCGSKLPPLPYSAVLMAQRPSFPSRLRYPHLPFTTSSFPLQGFLSSEPGRWNWMADGPIHPETSFPLNGNPQIFFTTGERRSSPLLFGYFSANGPFCRRKGDFFFFQRTEITFRIF